MPWFCSGRISLSLSLMVIRCWLCFLSMANWIMSLLTTRLLIKGASDLFIVQVFHSTRRNLSCIIVTTCNYPTCLGIHTWVDSGSFPLISFQTMILNGGGPITLWKWQDSSPALQCIESNRMSLDPPLTCLGCVSKGGGTPCHHCWATC